MKFSHNTWNKNCKEKITKMTFEELLNLCIRPEEQNKLGYWKVWHDHECGLRIESYYFGFALDALKAHYDEKQLTEMTLVIKKIQIRDLSK